MEWVDILIGAALLLFGRKLFWLFVGGIGFVVGFDFASGMLPGQPQWMILAIAICVGLIGAVVSIFLQRIVVGIAGFFAGGYFLSAVAVATLHNNPQSVQWIAFVVGGIVGAILTMALLDPALILLSSLAGATAISQHVPLDQASKGILFIVLIVVGLIAQTTHYVYTRKPLPPPETTER